MCTHPACVGNGSPAIPGPACRRGRPRQCHATPGMPFHQLIPPTDHWSWQPRWPAGGSWGRGGERLVTQAEQGNGSQAPRHQLLSEEDMTRQQIPCQWAALSHMIGSKRVVIEGIVCHWKLLFDPLEATPRARAPGALPWSLGVWAGLPAGELGDSCGQQVALLNIARSKGRWAPGMAQITRDWTRHGDRCSSGHRAGAGVPPPSVSFCSKGGEGGAGRGGGHALPPLRTVLLTSMPGPDRGVCTALFEIFGVDAIKLVIAGCRPSAPGPWACAISAWCFDLAQGCDVAGSGPWARQMWR